MKGLYDKNVAALAYALLALPLVARAQPFGTDGRLFGHLPYAEANPADLIDAPAAFPISGRCKLRPEVVADLRRMIQASDAVPGVGGTIRAFSCFRSTASQTAIFCAASVAGGQCVDPVERARQVAPPGYSEHATGYAIDFGTRPNAGCPDVDPCFAQSVAGRWLLANAPRFGFELSFPAGNKQRVTWESWHWRWVGATGTAPGASAARAVFARARDAYPAWPTTLDTVIRVKTQPPAVVAVVVPPPPPVASPAKGKPKPRR